MKSILLIVVCTGLIISIFSQDGNKHEMIPKMTEVWEPSVEKNSPADLPGGPPADAIILFDGTHMIEDKRTDSIYWHSRIHD